MSAVFFKKRLRYDESLSALLPALFDFWQRQDANFPRKKTVLLKPNMLSPHPPEEAITTHPLLVQLIATELRALGNRVLIADSPAGGHNKNIKRLWRVTGMTEAARQSGAQLVDINARSLIERKGLERNFFMTDLLNEVDYVVNMPKLKTHGLTLLTGAIKNVFGLIPGIQKGEFHIRYPNTVDFAQNMVEIFAAVRPDFTIMDAVEILEGNGPSSGGEKRYAGGLFAGKDAVAVDAAGTAFLGFDPLQVDTTRIAAEAGIGDGNIEAISITGDSLESIHARIPAPHIFNRLPGVVYQILQKVIWTRPRANPENCTHCGLCISNCPAGAMKPDADGVPVIDYQKCIHCFCCAEVCQDNAIYQEVSWLVKKLI